MADPKILARIEKLLRLAAPDSGTTTAERDSAALEAVRLITANNLTISASEPIQMRVGVREPRPQQSAYENIWNAAAAEMRRRRAAVSPFRSAIAVYDTECAEESCEILIVQGERVWRRMNNGQLEYVHEYCWTS